VEHLENFLADPLEIHGSSVEQRQPVNEGQAQESENVVSQGCQKADGVSM
jgi:hypothetical protein